MVQRKTALESASDLFVPLPCFSPNTSLTKPRQRLLHCRYGIRIRHRCERCIDLYARLLPLLWKHWPHGPLSPYNLDLSLDCNISTLPSNRRLLCRFLSGSSWQEVACCWRGFDHGCWNGGAVHQPYERRADGWENGHWSRYWCCYGYWDELCF
jgi:hypothetical protein